MAVPAEQVEVVRSAAPAAARAPKVKMVKKKDLSPELLSLDWPRYKCFGKRVIY